MTINTDWFLHFARVRDLSTKMETVTVLGQLNQFD